MIVLKVVLKKKVISSISKSAILLFFLERGKNFQHAQFVFLSVALQEVEHIGWA
jgi:hypothetical protein